MLAASILILAGPMARRAQAYDSYEPRYEATFGIGGAKAFEDDILNLTPDAGSTPDAFFDFRLCQNLPGPWSLGFHIYGTAERTPPYAIVSNGGGTLRIVDFELSTAHIGVDGRYLLAEGPVRPYFELGVSFVTGGIQQDDFGQLELRGYSVGGGPGIQFDLTRRFALGVEGVFAAGSAKWERRPFLSSSSREYDPSIAAVAGTLVYRWGR